jgi:metallo-beta-lactamase class B
MDMFKRLFQLASVALFCTSYGLGFCSQAHAANPANWSAPFKPFHVIDCIYYVGSAGLSAWIIKTSDGLILLDVGMPQNATMVEKNIQSLGFKLSDIKILLNSHAHFDHAGGLSHLKRDTGAKLEAGAGDKTALETGKYIGWEDRREFDFPPVKVDRVLADGDKVTLGDVTLTARITPGHTAGATTYLMPVEDKGVHHEVIFFPSISVAGNRLAPKPQYPGIVDDYRKGFTVLKSINADIFLAPHAELFDLAKKRATMAADKPNPFIKPAELKQTVREFESDFDKELAKQTRQSR